ncbi:nucleotide pyrophosphatase [Vibrio sp. JPW-9-11-11]|uniref:alkaline phosphatase family protein n=1 Tax=Vibrio sp. JPW-9-11-11 TaxID=1416532 RepID=UPI00159442C8|nr:alkaline phosphatase family protein [Vibrio sp. JPW-9-11-11]NVD08579.1 nucleotide pyrophosphatase [Vibrio sp. JPW-9-11-11]
MAWLKVSTLSIALGCAISIPFSSQAELGDTPIIGGIFNSSHILKNQILGSLSYSTRFARDMTLFTIGGMTLETYLLTLPLDAKTKASVMGQLADPSYSIPLGYFLYQFYDRYSDIEPGDHFKAHLETVYDPQVLKGFEHSLYHLQPQPETPVTQVNKEQSHHEGIKVDRDFIATMVTVYDALVQIGEWQNMEHLPDQYQYLTHADADLNLVDKIQPIVVDIIDQAAAGMDNGEMKNALLTIVADGAAERAHVPNNKAQALTITLIDFVRLNVLKAYRQFVFNDERQQQLDDWLQTSFDRNPLETHAFLYSQQHRRLAVQVTVDGLQQGLIEGLVDPSLPFVKQAYRNYQQREQLSTPLATSRPEHALDMRFLQTLAEQTYQDPNYLPFFKHLYATHRDSIAQVGISSTPTISVRNLPIIKTGAKVAGKQGTGIPNFHFVDREQDRAYYFFGNDALQLDRLMQHNQVQTMFDRLVHLKTLNCNAQYDWNAHTSYDGLVNLGAGEALRDFGEKRCLRELDQRAQVETTLTKLRQSLMDNITTYLDIPRWDIYTRLTRKWKIEQDLTHYSKLDGQGMPDYTLIYNPWPDHFAHFVGPFSDEIIMPSGELNRLDYWLRRVEQSYRRAGVYSQTLWGMAGDHGLAPVYYTLNPEKTIFEPLQEKLGYPLVVKKISSDEGEGPKITNALNYPTNHGLDVVVASTAGGNFMLDLFNAEQGWATQPVYSELIRWQPINAQAGERIDIITQALHYLGDSLDYMVLRQQSCNEQQCHVRLVAKRDGQRYDEQIIKQGERYYYGAMDTASHNVKLLDVKTLNPYLSQPSKQALDNFAYLVGKCVDRADIRNSQTWCNAEQWRELTRFTPRPDSVVQLAALYAEERAGTINLFPRQGVGYNTKVPGRHAGESYLEKDAFIGFWGAPVGQNSTPLTIEANGSLAPTLYEYLTGDEVVAGENGWGYPSLLNKLDIH